VERRSLAIVREGVKHTSTLMYTTLGEQFEKGGRAYAASRDDYEFGKMWMNLTEKLVSEWRLKAHPA